MAIDTDWIAGYVDGELDLERRRAVAQAAARDPGLAAALRREREAAAWLSASVRPVEEAVAPALAALLAPGMAVVPLPARDRRRALRWRAVLAAAALVLLAAGLGGGWYARHTIDDLQDRIARIELAEQHRLAAVAAVEAGRADALERSPNGTEIVWHSGDGAMEGRVKPTSTFVDGIGRFCREFVESVRGADGERAGGGIACRIGKNDWRLWWPDGEDPEGTPL